MTTQIALPLNWGSASTEADFVVSEANSTAVRHLEHWPLWPVRASLLIGPQKSGKSHLGRIFQQWSSGDIIDDAETVDETGIFHAWNRAQEHRRPLLIIAGSAPPQWEIGLPDLASRLKATPVVSIGAPDDALLAAVMSKQFHDCGLQPGPEVVHYILARIERSFEGVATIVAALDAAALSAHRKLTVPLARDVLCQMGVIDDS